MRNANAQNPVATCGLVSQFALCDMAKRKVSHRLPVVSRDLLVRSRPGASPGDLGDFFSTHAHEIEEGERKEAGNRRERIGGAEVSHGSQTGRKPCQIEQEPGDRREPKRPFGRLLALEAMQGRADSCPKKDTSWARVPFTLPSFKALACTFSVRDRSGAGLPKPCPGR